MTTCETCNASNKNDLDRVMRCMLCVVTPKGNTNWRPEPPAQGEE